MPTPRTIRIRLVDRERRDVTSLERASETIAHAACLVYDGRYFVFQGLEDDGAVRFGEVDPPVVV